jgi:hypothetical protein
VLSAEGKPLVRAPSVAYPGALGSLINTNLPVAQYETVLCASR